MYGHFPPKELMVRRVPTDPSTRQSTAARNELRLQTNHPTGVKDGRDVVWADIGFAPVSTWTPSSRDRYRFTNGQTGRAEREMSISRCRWPRDGG